MSLSYETHTSTGTPLLKADENLIETLEDNQVRMSVTERDVHFALFSNKCKGSGSYRFAISEATHQSFFIKACHLKLLFNFRCSCRIS